MNANTNKNREYDAKQASKVRPSTPAYDFTDLERVMHVWITGTVSKQQEIYSPYLGAL